MERRYFLRTAGALALLRPDSSHRARAATAGNNRAAEDLARYEDFWREIQSAFTLDRNIINLNNGGVSPSPRVVQESLRRALCGQCWSRRWKPCAKGWPPISAAIRKRWPSRATHPRAWKSASWASSSSPATKF